MVLDSSWAARNTNTATPLVDLINAYRAYLPCLRLDSYCWLTCEFLRWLLLNHASIHATMLPMHTESSRIAMGTTRLPTCTCGGEIDALAKQASRITAFDWTETLRGALEEQDLLKLDCDVELRSQ